MVDNANKGPFFVSSLEDSQGTPMVYTIAIRHGNGGHYLFHDYADKRDAQARCDQMNEAVNEWMMRLMDQLDAPLHLGEEAGND